ncbi:MAG TPA: hypothetical protein VGG75_15405 [Trebonia sp.]
MSATTDSGPAATVTASSQRGSWPSVPRRTFGIRSMSRPPNRKNRYATPSTASRVPIPTIVWNE